jgi:hypothetical protein
MTSLRTYIVGRSPYADIVIADPTVAERHAEIVEAADGRLFIADCASGAGTWRLEGTAWEPVRQRFVAREDVLLLGQYRCTLAELLAPLAPREPGPGGGTGEADPVRKGRVERDPTTGEIVRRRL